MKHTYTEEEKVSLKLTGKAIKNNEMVVSVSEYILPEGYIIKDENGNVINARKIILEKKKKEYPKTYEECCEIVKVGKEHTLEGATIRINYKIALLESFQKLLICRNAYWKLYGEEMGLGKPWEPDWKNNLQHKHYISTEWDEIKTNFNSTTNKVLAFPTEEMRDAFKENFDPDIEICKEFL